MPGLIQPDYDSSVAITVTNLHSLAASASLVAGWNGNSVSNLSSPAPYEDVLLGGTFTTAATNRQAGTIIVGVIGSLSDTPTWPTVASGTVGTEGALAFTALEQINSAVRIIATIPVTSTASQVYAFPMTSIAALFNFRMPTHWVPFVTGNAATGTNAQFAASGSALYYTPVLGQYT